MSLVKLRFQKSCEEAHHFHPNAPNHLLNEDLEPVLVGPTRVSRGEESNVRNRSRASEIAEKPPARLDLWGSL